MRCDMNTTAIVILICVIGIMNIASLIIGVNVGLKAGKGESIDLPNINPVKVFSEIKESKETEAERRMNEIMLENINNYDGTGLGQKDLQGW